MSERLVVALVAGEDPGWGGIGSYVAELGRGLRDLGHDVHLVLRGWEDDCTEELDGLVVHRVVVPEPSWRRGTVAALSRLHVTRESLVFSARVARRVAELARRDGVSVVEAPEFHAPGLVAGLRARLGSRMPAVVVRLHTPSYLTARLGAEAPALDLRATELLEHAAVRSAVMVTSPSAALAREVAGRWRLDAGRVRVLPNPIDVERFSPGPEPGPSAAPRILVVGRVERHKGQDVVLEALPAIRSIVPGAVLRLVGADGDVGAGAGSMTASLRARAAALGLGADAIQATGAIDRGALAAEYRAATVCVVPSRFDAFPYTCLEAMACARTVVASATGGLPEAVTSGDDGLLVPPGDPQALATAVESLLADPAERRRLGAAARATVERRFASAVVARSTADLYAEARA